MTIATKSTSACLIASLRIPNKMNINNISVITKGNQNISLVVSSFLSSSMTNIVYTIVKNQWISTGRESSKNGNDTVKMSHPYGCLCFIVKVTKAHSNIDSSMMPSRMSK